MTGRATSIDDEQCARFIADGFVRIDDAFPRAVAAEARALLWRDLPGCDPHDPRTWSHPVIRLGMYMQTPFLRAAGTEVLRDAFDRLVGPTRWQPCRAMGTFPVRFPSAADPGDDGWHVDAGFDHDRPDFLDWRVNVASRGRALLMLFLFSDVGENDAPTRIRVGSHRDVARALAAHGERGLTLRELVAGELAGSARRPEMLASGRAGTVYLCHPFLVHAAQRHRGKEPRFVAQPPLLPAPGTSLRRTGDGLHPVEEAIRDALRGDA